MATNSDRLTKTEALILASYWQAPLRQRQGTIELKKGSCWGVLCSIEEGKRNALILLKKKREKYDDKR